MCEKEIQGARIDYQELNDTNEWSDAFLMRDFLVSLVNLRSNWVDVIGCLGDDWLVQIHFLEDLANEGFDGCFLDLVSVFLATPTATQMLIVVWVCAQQILEKDHREVHCFSSLNVFNGYLNEVIFELIFVTLANL